MPIAKGPLTRERLDAVNTGFKVIFPSAFAAAAPTYNHRHAAGNQPRRHRHVGRGAQDRHDPGRFLAREADLMDRLDDQAFHHLTPPPCRE